MIADNCKFLALVALCMVAQSDVATSTGVHRPVAMIHGVTSNAEEFTELRGWMEKDFPGIKTFSLDAFDNYNSLPSIVRQIYWFSHQLEKITSVYGEVTLFGFSQGGYISRGVVQMSDNPFIHTLISASAPGEIVFY